MPTKRVLEESSSESESFAPAARAKSPRQSTSSAPAAAAEVFKSKPKLCPGGGGEVSKSKPMPAKPNFTCWGRSSGSPSCPKVQVKEEKQEQPSNVTEVEESMTPAESEARTVLVPEGQQPPGLDLKMVVKEEETKIDEETLKDAEEQKGAEEATDAAKKVAELQQESRPEDSKEDKAKESVEKSKDEALLAELPELKDLRPEEAVEEAKKDDPNAKHKDCETKKGFGKSKKWRFDVARPSFSNSFLAEKQRYIRAAILTWKKIE